MLVSGEILLGWVWAIQKLDNHKAELLGEERRGCELLDME